MEIITWLSILFYALAFGVSFGGGLAIIMNGDKKGWFYIGLSILWLSCAILRTIF